MRVANAQFGIRFCNIAPAKINTPMLQSGGKINDSVISVEDAAKIILWIYQQPQNVNIRDLVFTPTDYIG